MTCYSNGNGFSYISAGNYTAAMIQASDGEFVSAVIIHNIVCGNLFSIAC